VPELPDVEGFRRQLAGTLPGRRVRDVEVRDGGVLRNTTARALRQRLNGHRFEAPRRHGKWLILPTDGPVLMIHSGMTGHPYYAPDGVDERGVLATRGEGYERLIVALDHGQLRYADLRKLRGVWLAADEMRSAR
jgi:formamidopyrimidine-DNA glycosylase